MEVFVHRDPTGYVTKELEGIDELEELLRRLESLSPLDDDAEVRVEITGRWGKIKALLAGPSFADIWFNLDRSPDRL